MGKIELDHTGSGSGVTLSSDGTDLLLDGTAIGGGGGSPDLFAENYDGTSTLPSATGTNALALQDGAVASANRSIAVGQDAVSSGIYAVALGVSTDAINFYGTALGYKAQTASSDGATALTNSRASGSYSFAAAIANNTSSYGATGANSVAVGYLNKATGTYSYAVGFTSTASGYGSIALGISPTASGHSSIALGGRGVWNAQATAQSSIAIGDGARGDIKGKMAFAGYGMGNAGSQGGWYTLYSDTTDATAEAMTTTKSTASSDNQIVLPNNSAYAFHGTIVARQQASAGTASAAWKIEGLIRREGSAGTTVLVNSATTVLDNTPGWGLALSADTTNGGLKIEATGAASTNIRWVSTIHTSEVTYA
jgi:hypothetical protein